MRRYIERFSENRMTPDEIRNVGFPHSAQLVGRTLASAGGTIQVGIPRGRMDTRYTVFEGLRPCLGQLTLRQWGCHYVRSPLPD